MVSNGQDIHSIPLQRPGKTRLVPDGNPGNDLRPDTHVHVAIDFASHSGG